MKTQEILNSGQVTGLYSLIQYRDGNYGGLKTIAFLDLEGDAYSLLPDAPAYEYTVIPHVSGQEALQRALAFISASPIYMNNQISRILDPAGNTIGYEIRPLYGPLNYGVSDVMIVSYFLKAGRTVQINIELLPQVIDQILSRP